MIRILLYGLTACLLAAVGKQAHAINLWYDFEGDAGAVASDKLTADGSQDGNVLGNVSYSTAGAALFGGQSAVFDPTSPPFSTLEIPRTSSLTDSFSMALHAAVTGTGGKRFISGFRGISGAVLPTELVFDYLANGKLRAIYNGTTIESASIGPIADIGYQHFTLTIDNGAMSIFHNGLQVASGSVALGATMARNVHVGEDPFVVNGNAASEQLTGRVDDVVVIDRALLPAEIAALALGQSAQDVVNASGAALAVNYRFEGNDAAHFADSFLSDGAQDAIVRQRISVDGVDPKEGSGAALFEAPASHSKIVTPVTGADLGDAFTLSAAFNMPQGGSATGGLARIFSTYGGTGGTGGRLLLDVNPAANVSNIGVRLILPNGAAITSTSPFALNADHTVTAVFDQGNVKLFLDGVQIGATTDFDPLTLGAFMLNIGEDLGGPANENFVGRMDDVVILDRALSDLEVAKLHELGFADFQAIPEPATLNLALLATATAVSSMRNARRR